MANKITITNTKNSVTITPQSNTSINTSTTNTPITITQGTTSIVQVNNPGPRGQIGLTGPTGTFNANDNVIGNNITASANISASGTIVGSNLSGTNTGDQDLSTYALITKISGSFVAPSSSFSSRVSTLETNNTGTNTGDQDLSSHMLSANTASFAITSSNVLFGHITASGNISASGDIFATSASFATLDTEIVQPKLTNQELKVIGGNKLKLVSFNSNIEFRPGNILKHTFFDSGKVRFNSVYSSEPLSTVDVNGSISASGDITADNVFISTNVRALNGTGSFQYLKLNYDNMPTSDPNIKGVVYRNASNQLFISTGP